VDRSTIGEDPLVMNGEAVELLGMRMPRPLRERSPSAPSVAVLASALLAADASAQMARSLTPRSEVARPQLNAARALGRVHLDGRLDEGVWTTADRATDFRQIEPQEGVPSRFETVVRVAYDADHLYVGVFARDSLGPSSVRVRDLRRKFELGSNDYVGVSLDALHDGRSVVAFQVTPVGTQREEQVLDDGNVSNTDWEAVWRVRTAVTDSGWTAEIAIPWATLRYRADGEPWGVNFTRVSRRTNERSGWQPWPRSLSVHSMAYGGVLVGLEPPPPRRNLRVRPYIVSRGQGQGEGATPADHITSDVGGDVTWAPTPNSILDLTVNTDFAQADVDRPVVNLTRFSVFFPERRQFFLENAGLFSPSASAQYGQFQIWPLFTRRIGLDDAGNTVPIQGGARYVHRDARGALGALLIRQDASPQSGPSTFGVIRTSRNLGSVGRLGALVTTRTDEASRASATEAHTSGVATIDGFTRLSRFTSLEGLISGSTPWRQGNETFAHGLAGYVSLNHRDATRLIRLSEAVVTRDYDPATGFVSRRDVVMTNPTLGYDWRPGWMPSSLRRLFPYLATNIYHSASSGRLQESFTEAYVDFLFDNGALIYPDVQHFYQRLETPLQPVRGITIPAGTYAYWRYNLYAYSDQSAKVSYGTNLLTGGYYDRTLDEGTFSARVAPSPHVSASVSYSLNRIRGNGPSVVTHVVSPDVRLALNPRLQFSGFSQYNSDARRTTWNARLSWEFQPLSYLYVVYNERAPFRSLRALTENPVLRERGLIVKLTWMKQL
jgi:hypothetical protein